MAISFQAETEFHELGNVVQIFTRLSVVHRRHLKLWLEAGKSLGLLDAEAVQPRCLLQRGAAEVFVWVRESPDAAYRVHPNGSGWTVTDNLRHNELSRHPSFEAALEAIRPVFSFNGPPARTRAGPATQRRKPPVAALESRSAGRI